MIESLGYICVVYFQHTNGKMIVNHIGDHCYVDNVEPPYQNSWDMRSSSPAGSNRNSAASSDSGRGLSTNYLDPKVNNEHIYEPFKTVISSKDRHFQRTWLCFYNSMTISNVIWFVILQLKQVVMKWSLYTKTIILFIIQMEIYGWCWGSKWFRLEWVLVIFAH